MRDLGGAITTLYPASCVMLGWAVTYSREAYRRGSRFTCMVGASRQGQPVDLALGSEFSIECNGTCLQRTLT
jgi:hypothetical protein